MIDDEVEARGEGKGRGSEFGERNGQLSPINVNIVHSRLLLNLEKKSFKQLSSIDFNIVHRILLSSKCNT